MSTFNYRLRGLSWCTKGAVALNSAAVPFSCTFFEVVLMQFLMKPLETTAFIKKQKPPPLLGSGDSW